jgi:transaldolase
LWASTSTKNPAYPDTYYVDNLIGPQTVDTVPLQTLEAFRDHGTVAQTLDEDLAGARNRLEALESVGISMEQVTEELERQGVAKFAGLQPVQTTKSAPPRPESPDDSAGCRRI